MKRVHGSYMQTEQAIEAVKELEAQGYSRDQIRVVSIKDCGTQDCKQELKVEDGNKKDVKDKRSLWQKFVDVYTYSDYKLDYWNSYVEEDEVLKTYKSNLENGEILVLTDLEEINN